jgi:amidase
MKFNLKYLTPLFSLMATIIISSCSDKTMFKREIKKCAKVSKPGLLSVYQWQNNFHYMYEKANLDSTLEKVEYFEAAYDAGMQIINYENWQAFGELTQTGLIGSDVNGRLLKAAHTTLEQVKQAEVVRAQLTQELDALLEKYDALVLPTLPQIPPKVSEAENTVAFLNLTALVRPFNLSGHPAISVPLETSEGLPVGLQIVSKHQKDEQLCAIAKFCVDAMQ